MSYFKTFYLLLFLSFISSACSDPLQERIEYTLLQAGTNRTELEKLLQHYKNEPLKQAAARFLVANMSFHHSYAGWEIDSMRLIKKNKMIKGKIDDKILKRWQNFDYLNSPIIKDIDVVKADILIDNIDLAFKVWEQRPWNKHYTFYEFCEYILPYRINNEPFENWRRIYYERYAPILDSLYQGNDVAEAARVMANYLKAEGFYKYEDFNLPHLGALFLLNTRIGYCRDNCDIATYVMRAVGIPITMDFYKMSPSYNSRHFWSALIDTTKLVIPFNYAENEISRQPSILEKKKGKVYRYFYGLQQEKINGIYADKTIPPFFRDSFLRDVSVEYFPNSNVKIKIDKTVNKNWGYLCVFTGKELIPIDIAKIHKYKSKFNNIESKLIYFPAYSKFNQIVPAGYPIITESQGVKYFIPDTLKSNKVILTRKYPIRYNRMLLGTAVGVKIEGDNSPTFKDAKLLYQVVDTPCSNYNELRFDTKKRFRYIRYSAPKNKLIQLGEWLIYAERQGQPLKIHSIHANHSLDELQKDGLRLITDGNWSTYYSSEVKGEQLIFDLGSSFVLDRIILIPRNDDNFIHLGDLYELFYHNGVKGWRSLGKQIAKSSMLHYENVPEGALLWLQNHTRGKEERCFYMKEGKQVFN